MKTIKVLSVTVLLAGFCCSCTSKKLIQNSLQNMRFDLDYDLTTPVYSGEIDKTVYLDFIDNSNMEYFTVVNNKHVVVMPFLVLNYWHEKFDVVLGEKSLSQPYREFLTDALLAECNRSTCFNLEKNQETKNTGPAYRLDIKIIQNNTQSALTQSNLFVFFITGHSAWDYGLSNYNAETAISRLKIAVRLTHGDNRLLEKEYEIQQKLQAKHSYAANEECLSAMTDCLSLATKEIVEKISHDLNFALSIHF